jgi:putative phosphoribosyl transferase
MYTQKIRRPFMNRVQAAEMLASDLSVYEGCRPLILAIPRGALQIGEILAESLNGDLDVVLANKIGAPYNTDYAIGAIDETGWNYLAPDAEVTGATWGYLEQEKLCQLALLKKRREQYTPEKRRLNPGNRVAIVIDDGIASDMAMLAALRAVRAANPSELVCAIPAACTRSLDRIRPLVDTLICLQVQNELAEVGQCYHDFALVDDNEVIRILRRADASATEMLDFA